MKKSFYSLMFLMGTVVPLHAQTLLHETFESCETSLPDGWEIINDTQPGSYYHWELSTNSSVAGEKSAYCNSGSYLYSEPVKEEWMITPALQLTDDTYKLEFKFKGAWAAASQKEYALEVRVSTDEGANWTQIWSFIDKDQVEASGVDYPWGNWQVQQPVINLSDYRNQNVRIAFVHHKLIAGLGKGNSAWVDDVIVEKYDPITTPVVGGSTSYVFENVYIGSGKYSEVMTLTNNGIETLEITGISGLEGTDFSSTIDASKVHLERHQTYSYQIMYNPTITGARNATLKIETNGGTLNVALQGTKKMLPTNYTYEGFESEFFPPLGWTKTGGWVRTNYGISGDHSAATSLSALSELITPRLYPSTGSHMITFDMLVYYNVMVDDPAGPQNYTNVYFTKDGGATWTLLFSNMDLNAVVRKELDLGTPASDNCYVKWSYELEGFDLSGGFDNLQIGRAHV